MIRLSFKDKEKLMAKEDKNLTPEQRRQAALAIINKKYGKNTLINIGDGSTTLDIPCIGSGILGVDLALGQAFPEGRISEVYGPESSGKTTLALHVAAQAQRQGKNVAFIDAEHALDLKYAAALGVNVKELDLCQPDSGEQGLNVVNDLIKTGAYGLIVIDSVAALTPQKELEGEIGDSHMGLQSRMMSQGLRIMTGEINKHRTHVLFINQLRMKIGVMFGNPETTPGGRALPFYASQRIDVRRTGSTKDKEGDAISNQTRIKIVKNKMSPPFREINVDIEFGKGISISGDILDHAVKYGLVDKKGAWYAYQGDNVAQGRERAKVWLEENQEILDKLYRDIFSIRQTGEIPDDEFIAEEVA
jgi:recombination protein RecA